MQNLFFSKILTLKCGTIKKTRAVGTRKNKFPGWFNSICASACGCLSRVFFFWQTIYLTSVLIFKNSSKKSARVFATNLWRSRAFHQLKKKQIEFICDFTAVALFCGTKRPYTIDLKFVLNWNFFSDYTKMVFFLF